MTRKLGMLWAISIAFVASGCAHLPDSTVNYHLAKSEVGFKVVRTMACDKGNNLYVVSAVTPKVAHSADRATAHAIPLAKLRSSLADADVKIDFYDDGRLKAVNATSTGEGEGILKTVVTLASTLAIAMDGSRSNTFPAECKVINDAGDKGITLTYEGVVDVGTMQKQDIEPDLSSKAYAKKLQNAIGGVYAKVDKLPAPATVPVARGSDPAAIALTARDPAYVSFTVGDTRSGEELWRGELPVGQLGTAYVLPIPSPSSFGKQVFAASFGESGRLTSVQYLANTGTGQALNVLNAAAGAVQPKTSAQKAAELNAEADLIAAQQRLVQCQADRTACK